MSHRGSISSQGLTVSLNRTVPAEGSFTATFASCTIVSGDLAAITREAQQAAGFETSVIAPFMAHRIGKPGDPYVPGFEDQYLALIEQANALSAQTPPAAADVVALVEQAQNFYENVADYVSCPGGSPNLLPGKQPYTYFVKTIGQLLLAALADPSAYSAADLNTLAFAALGIGVIGSAAPDAELAANVSQALFDALSAHLSAAAAANNKGDCTLIEIAATALGFTQLLADAIACATGA